MTILSTPPHTTYSLLLRPPDISWGGGVTEVEPLIHGCLGVKCAKADSGTFHIFGTEQHETNLVYRNCFSLLWVVINAICSRL